MRTGVWPAVAAATSSNACWMDAVDGGRLGGPADGAADQLDVLGRAGDVGREDDQDRDAQVAQLLDGLGRVEVVAAGDHEVRAQRDDLLDVDRAELGDVGDGGGGLRVRGEVLHLADDAVAHAEREQRLGRGGGQRHDLRGLGRDGGGAVLVVGQLDREEGASVGAAVAAAVGATVAGAADGAGVAGPGVGVATEAAEQAASATASRRPARARKGREGRASTGTPTRGGKQETPRFGGRSRGQAVDRTVTPDLSLEGSSGDGRSATGLPPQGAVTVAGLCRNHTGFATKPRRFCRDPMVPLTAAAYHPVPRKRQVIGHGHHGHLALLPPTDDPAGGGTCSWRPCDG